MPGRNNNNNNRRGRGRGRGGPNSVPTNTAAPPAGRAPRHRYPRTSGDIDVVTQQWPVPSDSTLLDATVGGGNVNRGRGAWRGGTPSRGIDSPWRGNSAGRSMRRGRGRGRGADSFSSPRPHLGGSRFKPILGKDAPLSDLLYAERPLLRPVHFVRGSLTPFLFQDSEDVLKAAPPAADAKETSQLPTADRVARLFRGIGSGVADSDSESESESKPDRLEEIDFVDLAEVRAEVDAIAAGSTTINQEACEGAEAIEEVDFADLATIRAKVDAAGAWPASRGVAIQGTQKQIKNTTQVSINNQPNAGQQWALSSAPTRSNLLDLKPFIKISNASRGDSIADQDTIMEESSTFLPNTLVEESPPPTTQDAHPISAPTVDTHALFVIDTAPSYMLAARSASDVILVDRTGQGETLGDEEEERIVYVAPHPRSGRASPTPSVPRVKLPRSSVLTGRYVELSELKSPVGEDDMGTIPERDPTHPDVEAGVGDDHPRQEQDPSLTPLLAPGSMTFASTSTSSQIPPPRRNPALRARKKGNRLQRQKKHGRPGFGAFGAMVSEARLKEEDVKEMHHPRWETRRRGDSDLDWGTEDEDEPRDEVDALSDGLGGMEIDPDLNMDVNAMQGFLQSMSVEGSRFVTMDDIGDEAQMQQEDEESQGGPEGSSASEHDDAEELDEQNEGEQDAESEEEVVFAVEEEILTGESDGAEVLSDDSDEDEDDLSPRSSFQARLRKLRERSRAQGGKAISQISEDDNEEVPQFLPATRSADDEEFIAHINDLLEENSQILAGRNRKQKGGLFRNLHQGYVDDFDVEALMDDPEFTTPVNKKKGKKGKGKGKQATVHFAAELEAQWTKDRAKKAAYKRQRQFERYLAALDQLSAANGGPSRDRMSRKGMRAAARLDPAAQLAIAPQAVVDMISLEAQLRRFVEDIGGRSTLAMPPMSPWMRKQVHEMAAAFGLKSVSKGKGLERYTTLIRTSRTGVRVEEGRVRAILKRRGGQGGKGKWTGDGGKHEGRGRGRQMPKQREGDEVGKEAPKIGESNIGFKMLASMGWSEGDRIGGTASVGIEAPLTAIIKNSKLGLGATR